MQDGSIQVCTSAPAADATPRPDDVIDAEFVDAGDAPDPPALSAVEGPAPSAVEGPAPSATEMPVLSAAGARDRA